MKILIFASWPVKAWSIDDAHVAELRRRFPRAEFTWARTIEEAAAALPDADAALTPFIKPEMVATASRLRWVHSPAAAVEGLLPLRELAAHGVTVTNSRGIQAIAMAEHVMGGLLILARKYHRMLEAQHERRWIQNDLVNDWPWTLHGKRMTVVGLGTIGLEVAKRAHAFGMEVTGVRRRIDAPRPRFVKRVVSPERVDDSLAGCDVLVLSAPGVAATKGMIRAPQIAMLNPGAIIANVARGAVIDETAMIEALRDGRLGGAVLDVFEREPLDPESPLWSLPNVVISPHASGFRANHWDEITNLFSDNLRRFRGGRPLRNIVDPAAGY